MKTGITKTFIYFCKKETNAAIRIFLQNAKRYNNTLFNDQKHIFQKLRHVLCFGAPWQRIEEYTQKDKGP